MKNANGIKLKERRGFTLVEVVLSMGLGMLVLAAVIMMGLSTTRSWRTVSVQMQADQDVNLAINRIVYGDAGRKGVRCAESATYKAQGANGWTVTYTTSGSTSNNIIYSAVNQTVTGNPGGVVLGQGIDFAWASVSSQTLAVTLRVTRVSGPLSAQAEGGTEVGFRNR